MFGANLIDNIDSVFTAHDSICTVTRLKYTKRISDLHDIALQIKTIGINTSIFLSFLSQ